MSTSTEKGGYVITLRANNIIRQMEVDDKVLRAIVDALGITQRAPNMAGNVNQIQSIYVYRGKE